MELIIVIAIVLLSKFLKAALDKAEVKPTNQSQKATYQMPKQTTRVNSAKVQMQQQNSQWQQVQEGRREAKNTTILQRAKNNTDMTKADVTLETLEAEHNHSERVSAATHHHPQNVIPETMLGSVEDLMVKGYDGSLCFERDFLGEGMDMINRFTLGGI